MINAEAENSQVVPAPVQTQHTWKEQRLLKQPVALNPAPLWFPSSARRLLNTTMSGSLIFPQKLQTIYVWTSEEKIETRLNDDGLFWCCDYLTQQEGNRVLFFNLFSLLFSPCWEKPRFCPIFTSAPLQCLTLVSPHTPAPAAGDQSHCHRSNSHCRSWGQTPAYLPDWPHPSINSFIH